MSSAILVTQCLQNDFVKPIGRYDPLPNRLHVGFDEARRLLGERPEEGPVARVMEWALSRSPDQLRVIHIRDWHDPADPTVRDHLDRFGEHCLEGSDGAAFAFPDAGGGGERATVVDSPGLNDFVGTDLAEVLAPHAGAALRVGLIGVWTEAKITFLAYELATRYPTFSLAVCSALTASSSRANHFVALDQLDKLLGVEVFESVGEFTQWLAGETVALPLLGWSDKHPEVTCDGDVRLGPSDLTLLRYLFRDCRSLACRVLDGGFSGNVVLGTQSVDLHGHRQAAHVVKIGPRDKIGQERTGFERIEAVLGNVSPRIADFADLDERGAIKYRYASMAGSATTFQKRYTAGMTAAEVERVLTTVFDEQLGRLYQAAEREREDLLDYYDFSPRWADSVEAKVAALVGAEAAAGERLVVAGATIANPCRFYRRDLARLSRRSGRGSFFSWVHGDLNGANIIIDRADNVWLIDFFHTHRGHVLRDLLKLENDLLYIFTPLGDDADLAEACRLTDLILAVKDLAQPPAPPDPPFRSAELERAWTTVRLLRSFYPALIATDRDPLQAVIGLLRYAVHTLGFDESSERQKRWALYTAGRCSELVVDQLSDSGRLRVDWLDDRHAEPGRVGLTLLPGRRDHGRDLDDDLAALFAAGASHFVTLVPSEELARYGVPDLVERARAAGLTVLQRPILDQKVIPPAEMDDLVDWIAAAVAAAGRVVVTCVGGLGRTGTVVGCYLRARGLGPDEAVAEVRRARSERAIETLEQEEMVRSYQRRRD